MITLNSKTKENKVSNETLRAKGEIPAVYYGPGKESIAITVNTVDFKKVFNEAGESTPISLKTPTETVNVMIHEVQYDAVKGTPIHVDFYIVDMNKKVQVSVPLTFDENAPAAKAGIGVLVKALHEIEIEGLPGDLPHDIHVSLETLIDLDSAITVAQLILPKGIIAITNGEEVVAAITRQVEEKEEVAPVDLSSIEVEKKGKKEEEGAEEAAK